MAKGFEYRVDGGSAVDAGDVLTIPITGLTAATEYDIEVRKRNNAGSFSAWSAVVSQTTQAGGAVVVQDDYNWTANAPSGTTCAFGSNVTAGNALIACLEHTYPGAPPSITDTQGNTYTAKGSNPSLIGNKYWWIFTAVAGSSGANTLTATFAGGSMHRFCILEVSGLVSNPYDATAGQNTKSNTSTPADTNAVTTTTNNGLVIAMFDRAGVSSTFTQATYPIKNQDDTTGGAFVWYVQPTAGSIAIDVNCTASGGYPVGAGITSFKAA